MSNHDLKKSNPIDEYFANQEGAKENISDKLFDATDDNIKQKTELNDKEIGYASQMYLIDKYLENKGIKPIFSSYLLELFKLKVSKDRKSRQEFVTVNSMKEDEPMDMKNNPLMKMLGRR